MIEHYNDTTLQLRQIIKRLWGDLSEDEIALYDSMRDVFFATLRSKYGIPRAEAEGLVRTMMHQAQEEAL